MRSDQAAHTPPVDNSGGASSDPLGDGDLVERVEREVDGLVDVDHATGAGRGGVAIPVETGAERLLGLRQPERKWTVADLAAGAAVSRSLLDERFREVLGRSPIRYLTEWRMHLAQDLLATTDLGIFTLARRVGYDSEEAFSRAFKRRYGMSPGRWRADHTRR